MSETPEQLLERVRASARYAAALDWGVPRAGHAEGTLRAHIAELEDNLARLAPRLTPRQVSELRLLIHAHDLFKPDARRGAAIADRDSHASLASTWLAELGAPANVLAVAQEHDVPWSVYRRARAGNAAARERLAELVRRMPDWDLFVAFVIIDGCTRSKGTATVRWFLHETAGLRPTLFTEADLPEYDDAGGSSGPRG